MLSAARWPQVRDLLAAAREHPEADREAWLRSATADDALREEVRSLLRASSAAEDDGFLAQPAALPALLAFPPRALHGPTEVGGVRR